MVAPSFTEWQKRLGRRDYAYATIVTPSDTATFLASNAINSSDGGDIAVGMLGDEPLDATFTAAASDVCTAVAHGMSDGQSLTVTTTTTLPAGLSASTQYFVINATTDTFKLSATLGGAAVNITDAGTGVHTFHKISAILGFVAGGTIEVHATRIYATKTAAAGISTLW